MKIVKTFISLFLMVGALAPIISVSFFNSEHRMILAPIAVLSAFIGTGLMYGFGGFRTMPKQIGNMDDTPVKINQTWMVFFITLVCNLLFANLCG
jgi:hypothetical protein